MHTYWPAGLFYRKIYRYFLSCLTKNLPRPGLCVSELCGSVQSVLNFKIESGLSQHSVYSLLCGLCFTTRCICRVYMYDLRLTQDFISGGAIRGRSQNRAGLQNIYLNDVNQNAARPCETSLMNITRTETIREKCLSFQLDVESLKFPVRHSSFYLTRPNTTETQPGPIRLKGLYGLDDRTFPDIRIRPELGNNRTT